MKNNFPKDFLQKLEARLASDEVRLEKIVRDLEREDPFLAEGENVKSADVMEEAGEEIGHTNVETQREEALALLSETRKALGKIKDGTYGVCERCKDPIEKARLKAYPQTRFCLDCSKILEEQMGDEHVG